MSADSQDKAMKQGLPTNTDGANIDMNCATLLARSSGVIIILERTSARVERVGVILS